MTNIINEIKINNNNLEIYYKGTLPPIKGYWCNLVKGLCELKESSWSKGPYASKNQCNTQCKATPYQLYPDAEINVLFQ